MRFTSVRFNLRGDHLLHSPAFSEMLSRHLESMEELGWFLDSTLRQDILLALLSSCLDIRMTDLAISHLDTIAHRYDTWEWG